MKSLKIGALMALCALPLMACASQDAVVGSTSIWGLGGENKPDGTAAVAAGAIIGDFAVAPVLAKDANGNMAAVKTDTPCGGKDAISIYAALSGTATAAAVTGGTTGATGPSTTGGVDRFLALGYPAILKSDSERIAASQGKASTLNDCGTNTPAPTPSPVTTAPL